MNTRRFEDLFYRFSLRPSLFICERFFLRSDVIRPLFKHILWRFQQIFYRTFSCSSWQFKASVPYPGWVRRGREPSTPRRALSCLNDIATMSASYLALSCLEHVLLLCLDLLATDLALPHQPCIPLTLGAGGGACRKPSVWAAVALSPGGLASCAVALFAALRAARH